VKKKKEERRGPGRGEHGVGRGKFSSFLPP